MSFNFKIPRKSVGGRMSANDQGTAPTPAAGPRGEEASSSGRLRAGSGSAPAVATTTPPSQQPANPAQLAQNQIAAVDYSRQPTIRIQRQSSRPNLQSEPSDGGYFSGFHNPLGGRNRSGSDPARRTLTSQNVATPGGSRHAGYMPGISEGASTSTVQQADSILPVESEGSGSGNGVVEGVHIPPLRHARTTLDMRRSNNNLSGDYEDSMIDFLDVMDPEVSTLTTLTNVQNSLFVPDLGKYLNRRPTYLLSQRPTDRQSGDSSSEDDLVREGLPARQPTRPAPSRTTTTHTLNTISSRVNDNFYAVLPHGTRLEGWTEEEKLEMNDYVRHMLHSKRSKFRRSMKGFSLYVRKPLGFFVTLYATLITLFGLAWVLFLIGWVNVGGKQIYIIHIIDSVLVALFAVVGDGLAPFRAVDTYHMCFIAHYHHLTWRLRCEQALPKLQNKSDLPALPSPNADPEKALSPSNEFSVLSPEQQRKLEHHQKKFAKSHSFYKPHETFTHKAFSLRLLVAVVVLLDCHSLLQIALGACTWGIDYHTRPFAITTVILCCSITINITAGILISVGDKRSRKKDVVEKLNKQTLTEEAIAKVERKKERELKKELERRGLEEELEGRKSLQFEGRRSLSLSIQGVLGRGRGEGGSEASTPVPKDDDKKKRGDDV